MNMFRVLQRIEEGQLRIVTANRTYSFPQHSESDLRSEIVVKSDVFWIRLVTMGDLGFAEAYMYGEVDCEDLISTFKVHFSVSSLHRLSMTLSPRSFFEIEIDCKT